MHRKIGVNVPPKKRYMWQIVYIRASPYQNMYISWSQSLIASGDPYLKGYQIEYLVSLVLSVINIAENQTLSNCC